MDLIIYVYMLMYTYVSEMNDSNLHDTRDKREKLEVFCCYKVLVLSMKWNSVV